MKILIADDEAVSREVLQKILQTSGTHQITVAENGKDAWAFLDDPNRAFDIAFLDVTMPEPDGLEVLKRVRQSPLLHALQVVMFTASADRSTVAKAIQLGAQHYLVKPCNEASVLAKLKQIQATLEAAS